eukprot:106826-Chlamydomonas_euryale.AAC.1
MHGMNVTRGRACPRAQQSISCAHACMRAHVCAFVRACARARACECVRACVQACVTWLLLLAMQPQGFA